MIIRLLVASSIYFISGKTGDGIFKTSINYFKLTQRAQRIRKVRRGKRLIKGNSCTITFLLAEYSKKAASKIQPSHCAFCESSAHFALEKDLEIQEA
jgi:metal-dependent hydrolase (beta-lactamase superfamily II)